MKLFGFLIALFTLSIGFTQEDLEDGLYANFITDKGEILIKLEYEKVPMTVANFVGLAEGKLKYDTVKVKEPYYDSLKFHRVIAKFMIQGGDPNGNGTGGPGYAFPDEFDSTLIHDRAGTLSMANSGPNTNGSQFFITHKDTPWLNGKHSVFGYVVKGQDVVNTIKRGDYILSVEIIRVGKDAKKFKAHKIFPKMVEKKKEEKEKELEERNETFCQSVEEKYPDAIQTKTGLLYQVMEKGNGKQVEAGDTVYVQYTGFLMNGKKFDSTYDRGKMFNFVVDKSRVILGWHEGLKFAEETGKVKLIIPHWLAYGPQGRSKIPPYSTLIFDIEVVRLGKGK